MTFPYQQEKDRVLQPSSRRSLLDLPVTRAPKGPSVRDFSLFGTGALPIYASMVWPIVILEETMMWMSGISAFTAAARSGMRATPSLSRYQGKP